MTGPAQTPVLFVKAGDTNVWFSPECVKALAEASLNPDDFGTYEHVNAKIMAAQRRVRAAADAQRLGLPGANDIQPSARDRMLANSTAGHMIHNGVAQQNRNTTRECSNAIDGYHHNLAPATPMENGAMVNNRPAPESINGRWSDNEQMALAGRRPPANAPFPAPPAPADPPPNHVVGDRALEPGRDPGPPRGSGYGYNPTDRRADERQRIDDLARDNAARQRTYEAPAGSGATGAAPGASGAAAASGARPEPPKNGAVANGGGSADPSAADCIESFKNLAEQQMKDACANATVNNGALETDPARANALARHQRGMDAAQQEMNQIDAQLNNARPGFLNAQSLRALHERRADAQARFAQSLRGQRDVLNAGCLRQQGERLRGTTLGGAPAGPARVDGRLPNFSNI